MAVELKRIGWKDEPSEDTPIDSGNLKQMENNTQEAITELENTLLEKIIPIVLFKGNTNGTITLKEEISNYSKLKIYFRDNDGGRNCVEVDNSSKDNTLNVALCNFYNGTSFLNFKLKMYKITGKTMNGTGQANYEFSNNQIAYNNNIYVTLVEGYK